MIITVGEIEYEYKMSPAKNNGLCFTTPPASPSAIASARRVRDLERTLFPVWTRAKIWLRTRGYAAWGVGRVLEPGDAHLVTLVFARRKIGARTPPPLETCITR